MAYGSASGYVKWILEKMGMVFLDGEHSDVMDLNNMWKSYLIYDESGSLINVEM